MPRGYVRTGKNADPEFRKARAKAAAAARHGVGPALKRIAAAAERGELTTEQIHALREIVGAR